MALTIDNKESPGWTMRPVSAQVDFDSSYPTGGESLTPSQLGLETVAFLIAESKSGYTFEYDYTNKKLKAFTSTAAHTHTENTSATYVQNATTSSSAAAAASEVANATDLSAVTNVRVLAFGR